MQFNHAFNPTPLHLYAGTPSLTLVNTGTGISVRGSLLVSADHQTITFVRTGTTSTTAHEGFLPDGTYRLTLSSSNAGFVDTDGSLLDGDNGTISSVDASMVSQFAVRLVTGFARYKDLDPILIGDVTQNGAITSVDASYISQFSVRLAPAMIPPLPTGITLMPGGPDPRIWISQSLSAAPGATLAVPVQFLQTSSAMIGLEEFELALSFDPAVLRIESVQLGSLPAGFNLNWSVDAAAGQLLISGAAPSGTLSLSPGAAGSLVSIQAAVLRGTPSGSTVINLRRSLSTPGGPLLTGLNEGNLVLVPAPTDAADDAVDGRITIRGPLRCCPRRPPSVVAPRPRDGRPNWDYQVAPRP